MGGLNISRRNVTQRWAIEKMQLMGELLPETCVNNIPGEPGLYWEGKLLPAYRNTYRTDCNSKQCLSPDKILTRFNIISRPKRGEKGENALFTKCYEKHKTNEKNMDCCGPAF